VAGEEVGGVLELVVALPPRDEEISHDSNKEQGIHKDEIVQAHLTRKEPDVNEVASDDGTNVTLEGLVWADLGDNLGLSNPLSNKILDAITASNRHAK
jgi:hypothetical protein